MLNMWKVTHCPSHFIYHSFLLSDYIPLFCFSLSPVSLWVARDPRWLLFATCVVKLHPEWTSACDGRAAASALCSWHPCFPGAIHSRCPPRSGAIAEGRGGQQTMWVVVHPCPLSGLYPGLHAGLFSSLPPCPTRHGRASPPCQHGQSSLPLSSWGDGRKQRRRRMKEPEYLPQCVCSSPTSCKGETTAMTPAIPWEISATLLSLCVRALRGGGEWGASDPDSESWQRERGGHLISMPGRQGTL